MNGAQQRRPSAAESEIIVESEDFLGSKNGRLRETGNTQWAEAHSLQINFGSGGGSTDFRPGYTEQDTAAALTSGLSVMLGRPTHLKRDVIYTSPH
nr:hypothetical protein MACL_00001571 [Theileria orientalis]